VEVKVLEKLPQDPWGRPYAYRREAGKGVVFSYGRDGQPGGSGEDADIFNPAVRSP
jgi:general secretion pathway protein G